MKTLAHKRGSSEVFVQTIFEGKSVRLEYRNLKLRIRGMRPKRKKLLQNSGVPRLLYNDTYRNWGGFEPKVLYVYGTIIASRKNPKKKYFVATEVRGENDVEYHNQITSMHLLFARNFFTLLCQSSWMHTDEVNPKTLKARLKGKANNRIERRNGKAFTPNPPIAMKLYDCMGFEPPKQKKGKSQ